MSATIEVGRVARAHGVRGELVIEVRAAQVRDWESASTLWLGEEGDPRTIAGVRFHRGRWILRLAGVDDRNAAEALAGLRVRVTPAPRPAGRAYANAELIGCDVLADTGEALGRVTEIIVTGANDVLVVVGDTGAEILLPDIPDCILNVDHEARRVRVHVMDGLR
jgi:16S rRNA processing protein RimM